MNTPFPDTTSDPRADAVAAPPACKRVVAVISSRAAWEPAWCGALAEAFGPIDHRGAWHPFEDGGYYAEEMGRPLWRGWLSFRGLADPSGLPGWKAATRGLERHFADAGRRTVNFDAGYLDADKLVLASFKPGPRKLYLGGGVWADMILGYYRGGFEPLPGAFPDFRDGRYDKCLGVIRDKLKAEMRR